ncbi:MAG: protein phosphatase 2C domain-containing protein [Saprospiraceae bacterium]
MKFYELSHIGEFHTNHNEDFLVSEEAGKSRQLIAVMDGCSSGTDSHFASTLIGKLLRKIAKQESYEEFAKNVTKELKDQLEQVSLKLFEELSNINRQLDLRSDEILSTLILGLIDTKSSIAEIVIIGDGLIHVNGKNIEFENDNKPDYIGYHLNMDKHLWYQTRTEKLTLDKIEDLTISTDGIHTFKNFDGKSYDEIDQREIMSKFFEDKSELENANKLKKTLIEIKNQYGLMPSDDLTMIRLVNE